MLVHKIKSLVNPNPNRVNNYTSDWDYEDDPMYVWRQGHSRPAHISHIHDHRGAPKKFDKLGYAQYLERTGIKKGDVLLSKSQSDKQVNQIATVWMNVVLEVQEIHHLVDYSMDYQPKCIWARGLSNKGTVFLPFWTCPEHYNIVKYEDLSDEAKLAYDQALNPSTPASC